MNVVMWGKQTYYVPSSDAVQAAIKILPGAEEQVYEQENETPSWDSRNENKIA